MGMRYGVALAWAALIGLPMGGVAYLMDFPADAAALVAVLGGSGAAAAVLVFWRFLTRSGAPPDPR